MEIEDKLNSLKAQFEDQDDLDIVERWREGMRKLFQLEDYLKRPETKALSEHLKDRVKVIRTKLSSTVGMEKVDNLAMHAKLEELSSLLSLLAIDPQKEMRTIEQQVDKAFEEMTS